MVSPEVLVLQGNIVGANGPVCFIAILSAMALHGLNAKSYQLIPADMNPRSFEILLLKDTFGSLTASILLLASRPVSAVCLGTATLVASGFVFNEVFVYWFPNFGFAVLVMLALLVLNLIGGRAVAIAQVFFVTVAVIGLLVLSVWAMLLWFQTGEISDPRPVPFTAKSIVPAALLFIGYDLLNVSNGAGSPSRVTARMLTGIFVIGILALFWGLAAYRYVPSERLADSTLPHILTARKIGGQSGRVIIGLVVIAGTCAALNVLFHAVSRMMMQMAYNRMLPALFSRIPSRSPVPLFFLAAGIGLGMAAGFAGSDLLDKSIRAGLLFWLLSYAMTHLALFIHWHRVRSTHHRSWPAYSPVLHAIVFCTMFTCFVSLVLIDDNIRLLLLTMSVIFSVSLLMARSGLWLAKISFANREHK